MSTTSAPAPSAPLEGLTRFASWRPTGDSQSTIAIGTPASTGIVYGQTGMQNPSTWVSTSGTGTRNVALMDNEPCMEIVGSGTGVILLRATSWTPRLLTDPLGARGPTPTAPVLRWLFRVGKRAGDVDSSLVGINFQPLATTAPTSVGLGGAGWALVFDAAEVWLYRSRVVGGGAIVIEVNLGQPAPDVFHEVEFRILPATRNSPAINQFLLDGVLRHSQAWDDLGQFYSLYSDGPANSASLTYSIRHQDALAPSLCVARVTEIEQAVSP